MVGYPVRYKDTLKDDHEFTSEALTLKVSNYWILQQKASFWQEFAFSSFVVPGLATPGSVATVQQ